MLSKKMIRVTSIALVSTAVLMFPTMAQAKAKKKSKIELSSSVAISGPRYTDDKLLRLGSEGQGVTKLQKRLKELGYFKNGVVSGYYGNTTRAAVYDFQIYNSLDIDGIVGSQTQKAVYDEDAKPAPAKNASKGAAAKGLKTVEIAKKSLGKKYSWGGNGPNAFDCSGLVYYVLKQQDAAGPRNSYQMSKYAAWPKVAWKNMRPGDLMFFDTDSRRGDPVGHVGIYIGSGKMIHASTSEGKVVFTDITSGYYKVRFVNARRVFS